MSKHTPGPWVVVRRRDGLAVTGCGVVLFGDQEESAADANLIAAAPELYDSMLELLDSHQREEPHHEDMCPVCRKAKAAIAKAKGA